MTNKHAESAHTPPCNTQGGVCAHECVTRGRVRGCVRGVCQGAAETEEDTHTHTHTHTHMCVCVCVCVCVCKTVPDTHGVCPVAVESTFSTESIFYREHNAILEFVRTVLSNVIWCSIQSNVLSNLMFYPI